MVLPALYRTEANYVHHVGTPFTHARPCRQFHATCHATRATTLFRLRIQSVDSCGVHVHYHDGSVAKQCTHCSTLTRGPQHSQTQSEALILLPGTRGESDTRLSQATGVESTSCRLPSPTTRIRSMLSMRTSRSAARRCCSKAMRGGARRLCVASSRAPAVSEQ